MLANAATGRQTPSERRGVSSPTPSAHGCSAVAMATEMKGETHLGKEEGLIISVWGTHTHTHTHTHTQTHTDTNTHTDWNLFTFTSQRYENIKMSDRQWRLHWGLSRTVTERKDQRLLVVLLWCWFCCGVTWIIFNTWSDVLFADSVSGLWWSRRRQTVHFSQAGSGCCRYVQNISPDPPEPLLQFTGDKTWWQTAPMRGV